MEATGLLTHNSDAGIMTLVNAHNRFNEPSRLEIMLTVQHR